MPYYSWRGVRFDASWCKGTMFARSEQLLERRLLQQEIALTHCVHKTYIALLPVSFEQKLLFFQHFYALLAAGIHVWQALNIISEQTSDPRFAQIVDDIASDIERGAMLDKAFAQYEHVFLSEMIHVLHIGMQSDNLPVALNMLCNHLQATQEFKKAIRSALLLPIITFGIFLSILLVILLFIVPKYAQLFASMSKDVPTITRVMMQASAFVSSYYMMGTLFILITIGAVVIKLAKKRSIKLILDTHFLAIPYIGNAIRDMNLVYFLNSLSLLLEGGMPLVPALYIAKEAMKNSSFKEAVENIAAEVEAGNELSDAMQQRMHLFAQDTILLVTVGQETGHLQQMVQRAGQIYNQKVQRTLKRYTMLVQPLLMIILGLLVAGLVFAVYVPLFNLADVA